MPECVVDEQGIICRLIEHAYVFARTVVKVASHSWEVADLCCWLWVESNVAERDGGEAAANTRHAVTVDTFHKPPRHSWMDSAVSVLALWFPDCVSSSSSVLTCLRAPERDMTSERASGRETKQCVTCVGKGRVLQHDAVRHELRHQCH